jgi:glycosyltransferase involved in cell wall biosynthesis
MAVKKRVRDRFDMAELRIEAREELENARAFSKILVNSYFSRESVMRAYGLNSEVCYLGIDTDKFVDLGLPREPFVIGLGTIARTKNVELAIRAIGAITAPRPSLVWVGNMSDPVYVPQMAELAKSLGVDFQPKKMIPDEELIRLLNLASAMLYTSRLEPFGLAPLEANACGLPVVAVAEGGVRETVVDGLNGRLLPHDPQILGAAVAEMLANPQESRQMGQVARRMVQEKWTITSCVDRIEDALLRTAGI